MPPSTRWTPRLGATVRFRRGADDVAPPSGTWKLISRNDRGPQNWWAMALDADAKSWAASHPSVVLSGCVDADGARLTPVNGVRF